MRGPLEDRVRLGLRLLQSAVVAVVLMGCSGKSSDDTSDSGDTGTTSPDAAPCALRSDSGLAMTPGDGANTTAPAIQEMNSPYTIELAADRGGWVRLVLPHAGTYTLHTGFAGVALNLLDDAGEVGIGMGRANDVCPTEIPEVFTITVDAPTTYYLQLGPLSAIYFWVLVQPEAA